VRKEKALRYLLLRHLCAYREAVSPGQYAAVTRSLAVTARQEDYLIRWEFQGQSREWAVAADDFDFYRRGDTAKAAAGLDRTLATQNDRNARRIAERILGVAGAPQPRSSPGPLSVALGGAALQALAVLGGLSAGGAPLPSGLAVAALPLLELLPYGRLVVCGWLILLAGTPLVGGALGLALAYGVMQYLDPDPVLRPLRAGLCVLAAILGVAGLASLGMPLAWVPAAFVLAASIAFAVFRDLYLIHDKAMGLTLPFFAAGLVLSGDIGAGLATWGALVVAAMVWIKAGPLLFSPRGRADRAWPGDNTAGDPAPPNTAAAWDRFWTSHFTSASAHGALSFIRKNLIARGLRRLFARYFPEQGIFVEMGSGSSETSARLTAAGRTLICLDFSLPPLLRARTMPPISQAVQGDLYRLPFADDSLDGLWNLGVMEHFTEAELEVILEEFRRVLKPGGRCLLLWPPRIGWYKACAVGIETVLGLMKRKKVVLYPGELTLYTSRKRLEAWCGRHGFSVKRASHTPFDLFTYVVVVIDKNTSKPA
jgi:SAM-dependent methyltransferase